LSQSSSLAGLSSSIEEASLACTRVLSKTHFKEMATKIYGQFNLGFIIAGVGHDLFILDQHACDEKFRFESYRRDTEIHVQRLLVPRDIDLTAAEELVILGNLDVFARNGFHFSISGGGEHCEDDKGIDSTIMNESREKRKIRVSAFPFSKQTQFGDEDVRELASILADRGISGGAVEGMVNNGGDGDEKEEGLSSASSSKSCGHNHSEDIDEDVPVDSSRAIKLPRLNAMFASRACRSAVMIGTALEHYMMRKIVHQMAALEDPWCCPHGRPTLRHLVDLSAIKALAKKLSLPGRD
jgi:DNA mismatch repair protein PMS2